MVARLAVMSAEAERDPSKAVQLANEIGQLERYSDRMFKSLGDEIDYLQQGSKVQFSIVMREYVERQCEFNRRQLANFNRVLEGHDPEFDQSEPVDYAPVEEKKEETMPEFPEYEPNRPNYSYIPQEEANSEEEEVYEAAPEQKKSDPKIQPEADLTVENPMAQSTLLQSAIAPVEVPEPV